MAHHDEFCRYEKWVWLAVKYLRPEVKVLNRTDEPIELGEKHRKVESEHAGKEECPDESFPSLQQKRGVTR